MHPNRFGSVIDGCPGLNSETRDCTLYLSIAKPARRFCCQHASFDSRAERLLLAVADHADPRCRHARRHQRVLGRVGAPLAQRQVVFVGTALVAVAADHNLHVRMAHQVAGVLRERRLRIACGWRPCRSQRRCPARWPRTPVPRSWCSSAPPRPAAHSRSRLLKLLPCRHPPRATR